MLRDILVLAPALEQLTTTLELWHKVSKKAESNEFDSIFAHKVEVLCETIYPRLRKLGYNDINGATMFKEWTKDAASTEAKQRGILYQRAIEIHYEIA